MSRIRVDDVHRKWLKDPKYRAAFEAQREEFELASALIAARGRAGLTQAQLAKRMRTTQAAVARMESGRSSPSTRTLRRVAEATGTRLKISFQVQKRG
jgi:ribosome-binding protein aMBF1 (putative translation factor)